jgi:hypothetical protein
MPKKYPFTPTHTTLTNILTDHDLAQLGDAYTNLIYSLALSNQEHQPIGKKLKNTLLAQALKKANLRQHLPSRTTTHMLADAAEALLVYVWLHNHTTLQEAVAILQNNKDTVEALAQLLTTAKNRIKLS